MKCITFCITFAVAVGVEGRSFGSGLGTIKFMQFNFLTFNEKHFFSVSNFCPHDHDFCPHDRLAVTS